MYSSSKYVGWWHTAALFVSEILWRLSCLKLVLKNTVCEFLYLCLLQLECCWILFLDLELKAGRCLRLCLMNRSHSSTVALLGWVGAPLSHCHLLLWEHDHDRLHTPTPIPCFFLSEPKSEETLPSPVHYITISSLFGAPTCIRKVQSGSEWKGEKSHQWQMNTTFG